MHSLLSSSSSPSLPSPPHCLPHLCCYWPQAGTAQAAGRPKQTWEERYDDDPLRSDSPTRELQQDPPRFDRTFIAISSDLDTSAAGLDLREKLWSPHLQWARRSALAPGSAAAVSRGFTRLSADMMTPTGQLLVLEANNTAASLSLLQSEPLCRMNCVAGWKTYSADLMLGQGNLTSSLKDPRLFVGMYRPAAASNEELLAAQEEYHTREGRVATFARLRNDAGKLVGLMVLFNARSDKHAAAYLAADPMADSYQAGTTSVSPVNEQDMDGLHHLMARQFGEKTNLDQVT